MGAKSERHIQVRLKVNPSSKKETNVKTLRICLLFEVFTARSYQVCDR